MFPGSSATVAEAGAVILPGRTHTYIKYDINESPVFVLLIHFSRNADSSNITHMQRAIISVFVCLVPPSSASPFASGAASLLCVY